jgi:hypothetical protein
MSKYPGLTEIMEKELERKENMYKQYLKFKDEFKQMCESGEFYSDITQNDVQLLIDIIEELIK